MRARSVVFALGLALVLPASAAAADGTLSKDNLHYAWDGGPGSGWATDTPEGYLGTYMFGCGAPVPNFFDCEDTVLEVKDKGTLKVAIDAAADDSDLDLYLYRSDASGEFDPDEDYVDSQADDASDESVTVSGLAPGFYVAHVEFFSAVQETYAGTAQLTLPEPPKVDEPVVTPPPAAPAASPPPAQPAAPPAKKAPSKRAACLKKAKKLKKAKARKKAVKRCKRLKR